MKKMIVSNQKVYGKTYKYENSEQFAKLEDKDVDTLLSATSMLLSRMEDMGIDSSAYEIYYHAETIYDIIEQEEQDRGIL